MIEWERAMAELAQEVGNLLRQKGLTLGIVESATGGLISHLGKLKKPDSRHQNLM